MDTGSISAGGGVDPFGRYPAPRKKAPPKNPEKGQASTAPAKDSVILSSAARGGKLDQIREKLKKGYYDTDPVQEAVSEKLSGLFETEE